MVESSSLSGGASCFIDMLEPGSLIDLLLARLERISADSPLAHRASGVRGSLLRSLESQDKGIPVDPGELDRSMDAALVILRKAAAAVPTGRRYGA
ncbi:MAG: hypothetical protein V1755_00530 [Chloroflexota bacterium]